MKKNQVSIDGFSPRCKPKSPSIETNKIISNTKASATKTARVAEVKKQSEFKKSARNDGRSIEKALQYLDIDQDLRSKEDAPVKPYKNRRFDEINKKRVKKNKSLLSVKQFKTRRLLRRIIWLIVLIGLVFLAWKVLKAFNDVSKSFNGNLFDIIKKEKLKEDSEGRTNILLFGTSPKGWDGEDLTDSVIVISANQTTKTAKTISLPRDLWVKHSCSDWLGTTAGKLNETYGCAKNGRGLTEDQAETAGQEALAETAKKILGLDIHYKVHANWQVLIDVIDKLGGIDVTVEVWDGSPEMHDVATGVRYKNGQHVHMNGEQALAFSRARGSHGGYGLSGGNFDRERNQQKIIQATIQKINSAKYNPIALIEIATALGDNIKTSFKPSEIQTAAEIAQSLTGGNVKSLPLIDEKSGVELMTTGNVGNASVVMPSAGLFDYSEIQKYISKNTKGSEEVVESAKIIVLNGTDINGLAAEAKNHLTKDGLDVIKIGSAKNNNYKYSKIYDITKKSPKTIAKLSAKYSAQVEDLPSSLNEEAQGVDILLILGEK